jgi:hypothetical protein
MSLPAIAPCSVSACLVPVESVNAVHYKLKISTHPRETLDRSLSLESQTLKGSWQPGLYQ